MQARGSQDMSMEIHKGAPHSCECWAMPLVNMSSTKESQLTLHFISFFLHGIAWQVAEKYEPMIQAKLSEAEKEIKKKIG